MHPDLINQLINKDENAFRQIVKEYQDMIYRTCLGIVHNSDDADDLTQEVFIKAFNSIDSFRSDAKVSTWLYRIAINKSLNFIRDNKRARLFQSLGFSEVKDIADEQNLDDPFEQLQEKNRKKIMDQAIASLPANQKSAFVLNKVEELSYKEIAEIMEISISSVESLLFRARKNLQKKLIHCYKRSC